MRHLVATTLSLALCAGTAGAALAQQASAVPPSAPLNAPTTNTATPQVSASPPSTTQPNPGVPAAPAALSEIVVTAQRRSENLQNVPISVTAVSAAKLQAANIVTTADLAAVTPAITFSNVNGFLETRIRGIGNSSAGASVEDSVATYIDGVYIASATGSLLNLENIQQVEVLDGPQGTLFGRNATGGLIQINTKDPRSTLSANGDVSYENYDFSRINLYMTGQVFGPVDADLAVYAAHQGDGYGSDIANDKPTYKTDRDIAIRSKWLGRFGTGTTVRAAFDFSNSASTNPSLSGVPGVNSSFGVVPPNVVAAESDNRYDTDTTTPTLHRLIAGGASVRVDQDVGPLVLTDIAAYRKTHFGQTFDADGLAPSFVEENFTQKDEQVSEEIQIAPKHTGRLQWIAGFYYFHLDSAFDPLQIVLGPPLVATPTFSTNTRDHYLTESLAGYGQATYEILPDTNLTGGFRYTYERRVQTGSTLAGSLGTSALYTDAPTWRIALDHKFTPQTLGYISWNRGFKSGGFNSQVPQQAPYRPETLDDYEIGEKTTLLNGRLRLNTAFFYYEYRDIQVNTVVGSLGVILNGARARDYGIDNNFELSITPDLFLTGGVVYLHDRFTDFPDALIATVSAGRVTTQVGSATGNRLPFAPDATANLGVDYKHDVFGGKADLFINDLYNTGYFGQSDNVLHQGAFHLLNASLQYQRENSPLTYKLYAKNILNQGIAEYLSFATVGGAASYEPPTTYGFTVGFKF